MVQVTFTVSDEMNAFINAEVKAGDFSDESAYIRHLIQRNLQSELVGTFRTFGTEGKAYEVLKYDEGSDALIRVLDSDETLDYPIAHIQKDPIAD